MRSATITAAAVPTAIDGWTELASRENDGLAVFLLWSRTTDRIKVMVVDAKLDDAFDLDVAGAEASEAFNHPFAYAAGRSSCFGDALRESTDLQLQS